MEREPKDFKRLLQLQVRLQSAAVIYNRMNTVSVILPNCISNPPQLLVLCGRKDTHCSAIPVPEPFLRTQAVKKIRTVSRNRTTHTLYYLFTGDGTFAYI